MENDAERIRENDAERIREKVLRLIDLKYESDVSFERAARPVTSTRAVMEVEHRQSSEKCRNTPLR